MDDESNRVTDPIDEDTGGVLGEPRSPSDAEPTFRNNLEVRGGIAIWAIRDAMITRELWRTPAANHTWRAGVVISLRDFWQEDQQCYQDHCDSTNVSE